MLPSTIFSKTATLRPRPGSGRSRPSGPTPDADAITMSCVVLPRRSRWHTGADDFAVRPLGDLDIVLARPAPGIGPDDEATVDGVEYSVVDKDDYGPGHTRLMLRRVA